MGKDIKITVHILLSITVGIFLVMFSPEWVYAQDYLDEILEEMDLDEVDESIKQQEKLPEKFTFRELVDTFVHKGTDGMEQSALLDYVLDLFFYEIKTARPLFMELICIALLFAVFGKLLVTKQQYVSELSFFAVYTGILLLLLKSFSLIAEVVEKGVGHMISFMTAFVPVFSTALFLTGNAASSGTFYATAFGIIYLLELGMKVLFLPGVTIFVLILLMDHFFEETRLSKFAQLLEDAIRFLLKFGLAAVSGLGIVQSLIAPAKDRLSNSSIYHGLTAVPGVGNTFGAAGEILMGCGMVIKNSMGAAALVLLVLIALTPVIKVFGFYVMYRISAALLAPFCDKRIAQSVYDVGRGCSIYLKVMTTVMLLFFITISMISASTAFVL